MLPPYSQQMCRWVSADGSAKKGECRVVSVELEAVEYSSDADSGGEAFVCEQHLALLLLDDASIDSLKFPQSSVCCEDDVFVCDERGVIKDRCHDE